MCIIVLCVLNTAMVRYSFIVVFSLQVKFKLPGRIIFNDLLLSNLTDFCYLSLSLAVHRSSNALSMLFLAMGQEFRGLFYQIANKTCMITYQLCFALLLLR